MKQKDSAIVKAKSHGTQAERRRGRPKGSKNKAKEVLGKELALQLLDAVKPLVPDSHYQEMEAAIKQGKAMSTMQEARTMLMLMGPALMKRLVEEQDPTIGMDPEMVKELGPQPVEFRKDTNERLGVWMKLLDIVMKQEAKEADATQGHTKNQPLTSILVKRGLDAGRLAIHLGDISVTVGRDADGVGGKTSEIRTVSDTVPERQEYVPDSEQEPSVRVLDPAEYRDDS